MYMFEKYLRLRIRCDRTIPYSSLFTYYHGDGYYLGIDKGCERFLGTELVYAVSSLVLQLVRWSSTQLLSMLDFASRFLARPLS